MQKLIMVALNPPINASAALKQTKERLVSFLLLAQNGVNAIKSLVLCHCRRNKIS